MLVSHGTPCLPPPLMQANVYDIMPVWRASRA